MSKLIGTNPNQVPSNADLGTAAFMDKKEFLLSKGSEMSAINAVIPKTAVDVFIYDTTKDSDGGAWRKRTQHTSWYNEKLNTTTRGSRKEFPAVAVIVMEYASAAGSSAMTIYDGDNPTLPMWMSCQVNSNTRWIRYNGTIRSVAALNGIILAGASGGNIADSLLSRMDLICDKLERHFDGGVHQIDNRGIVYRNNNFKITSSGSQSIINRYVNDVAMTVLPNAPIDAATGLPVPTIAIGTDGGTSVIKDDGTVGSLTGFSPVTGVTINSTTLAIYSDSGSNGYLAVGSSTVATGSATYTTNWRTNWSYENNISSTPTALLGESATFGAFGSSNEIHAAGDDGYNIFLPSSGETQDAIAYIASDYNTGWMVGDTKLATLSDTDTTNAVGTELVTNGTFASNLSSWSDETNVYLTHSWNSGKLRLTWATNFSSWYGMGQFISTEVGKTYVLSADMTSSDSNAEGSYFYIYLNGSWIGDAGVVNGVYTRTFVAQSTSTGIRTGHANNNGNFGSGDYYEVDNISVRLAEEDRSVNNNGLQVFGTVTKTAVATGADLVGYSGFSTSNYLEQPYNSDLNFGTGDFSYSLWIYRDSLPTSTHERWFGTATSTGTKRVDIFSNHNTDNIAFYLIDGGSSLGDVRITGIGIGVWHSFVFTRVGNAYSIYHNGKFAAVHNGSSIDFSANTDRVTHIGEANHWDPGHPCHGKVALAKISATAPSAEQIKKMYNDEKFLFQENAKATLYGSSDAVTALAYDDSTELLHVGTSAGRSVFQGLRRVDNTTDAVGAAISASNGFIVED